MQTQVNRLTPQWWTEGKTCQSSFCSHVVMRWLIDLMLYMSSYVDLPDQIHPDQDTLGWTPNTKSLSDSGSRAANNHQFDHHCCSSDQQCKTQREPVYWEDLHIGQTATREHFTLSSMINRLSELLQVNSSQSIDELIVSVFLSCIQWDDWEPARRTLKADHNSDITWAEDEPDTYKTESSA